MSATTLQSAPTALSRLLTRYMRGEIDDSAWTRLMRLLDASDVSAPERMAYARFVNEVVTESGPAALFVPKSDEVVELLADTRH